MNVGHIYLDNQSASGARQFLSIVEGLDRLALDQHVLVGDAALARALRALPYVTTGPLVGTPVMAYCLMPAVDVVHIHDARSGQAGLLLTLTRSVPYVIAAQAVDQETRNPIKLSVQKRAQSTIEQSQADPVSLIEVYRQTVEGWSKFPENADSR